VTAAFIVVKLLCYFKTNSVLQNIHTYSLNDCEGNVMRVRQV